MSTLIRIPAGHMRSVPANKQADDASMELKPAKWPGEFIMDANDMGREAYLSTIRIQTILAPAIQATCRLNPEETVFFPTPRYPRHHPFPRSTTCPSRSLPHSPAISTPLQQTKSSALPQGKGIDLPTREDTTYPAPAYPATITTFPEGYTSSQRLPTLAAMHPLTGTHTQLPPKRRG